jgi:effector-binding domain-containing protein
MLLRMGVPIRDAAALTLPLPDGSTLVRLPASRVAFTTHRGAYEEIGLAHHAVAAWIHERGLEPSGPMFEAYIDDPALVPAHERRTEIVIPVG